MSLLFRSSNGGEPVSFAEAVLRGAPVEGGLYLPTRIPQMSLPVSVNRNRMFQEILSPWVAGHLSDEEQRAIADSVFSFPIPIVRLDGGDYDGIRVVELFHGPTGSFKDVGARWLSAVLDRLLSQSGERRRVIVATSGDTGSAVADAFCESQSVDVVLLFPKDGVSNIQRRQLTLLRPGVKVFGIDGTFDDCQRLAKKALALPNVAVPTTSANSISVGRLLPQMTYYAHTVREIGHSDLVFTVPSGNLGNLTAGLLASKSLGFKTLFVAAHNANDTFGRFFRGEPVNEPSIQTISNAMDVGNPSNLPRILDLLGVNQVQRHIEAQSFSDNQTLDEMKRIYEQTGYVCDPHTAVGLGAARCTEWTGKQQVVLSTAHPYKFADIVQRSTGIDVEIPGHLRPSFEGDTAFEIDSAEGERFIKYIREADQLS